MKANKLLVAAALFTGLATLGFAGPGPEYWARMNAAAKKPAYPSIWQTKTPAESTKVKPAATPASDVAARCVSCSGCQVKKS